MALTTPHTHSSTCWKDTGKPECYEFRLKELEAVIYDLRGKIAKWELDLRAAQSPLDRATGQMQTFLKEQAKP